MQPFLEIPTVITNNESESKTVQTKIRPHEIEYYYPGFHWGVVIVTKSGHSLLSELDPDLFSNALEAYYSMIAERGDKFGTAKIEYTTKTVKQ